MKSITTALSLTLLLGVAACNTSPYNPNRPTDTGNMAYPTPVPQGNIAVTQPTGPDTGSMAQPRGYGGRLQQSNPGPDTGNMALPSRAQGNSRPGSYY